MAVAVEEEGVAAAAVVAVARDVTANCVESTGAVGETVVGAVGEGGIAVVVVGDEQLGAVEVEDVVG